jgi:hypothetical protein
LKLGALGLLKDLDKLFNTDASSIYVLPTAEHYMSNSKNLRIKYSEALLMDILALIKNYQDIPSEFINDEIYLSLTYIDKIDSGERLLFSLNPADKDFLILTGDKNSIIQLSNQQTIDKIKNELAGKIVCLEHIVLKLLEVTSFELIETRMREMDFGGDKTLKLVFNQYNLTVENARSGLLSFYNDLYRQSNNLLLPLRT